jgi:glycosyltransferase involved in cell wall biosynthesis
MRRPPYHRSTPRQNETATESVRTFVAPNPPPGLEPGPAPTFSVVIAAYDAAATIGEAVASALNQSLPAHEIIVCDDGSTDDIDGALAPYRDRIVLLQQENAGAASARNRALRAASGQFVAPLDSDDVFLPHRLEVLGELAAARPDLDIVSTDVYFEVDGEIVGRFYEENRFAVEEQRLAILEACFVGWPAARREALLAVGGFDESFQIAYDWAAWTRMILAGARAGLVPEPQFRYRVRPGSLSADRARSLRERVALLDAIAREQELEPEERRALAKFRRRANSRALAAEAHEALLEGRSDARRRAFAVAVGPGSLRTRALGVGAAVLPRLGQRALRRRLDGTSSPYGGRIPNRSA